MHIHLYKLDQMCGAVSVIVEYINIYFDYKIASLAALDVMVFNATFNYISVIS